MDCIFCSEETYDTLRAATGENHGGNWRLSFPTRKVEPTFLTSFQPAIAWWLPICFTLGPPTISPREPRRTIKSCMLSAGRREESPRRSLLLRSRVHSTDHHRRESQRRKSAFT